MKELVALLIVFGMTQLGEQAESIINTVTVKSWEPMWPMVTNGGQVIINKRKSIPHKEL